MRIFGAAARLGAGRRVLNSPRNAATAHYVRVSDGRIVAGVARGLSVHLGTDVLIVRIAFLLLALGRGAGVVLYAALWFLAPLQSEAGELREERPSETGELGYLLALGAFVIGGLLAARTVGVGLGGPVLWPLAVAGFGVVIVWRQVDDVQRARFRAATGSSRRLGAVRAGIGVVLVVAGGAVLLAAPSLSATRRAFLATAVVVVGLALVSGPYWARMARDLTAERAARIREQERAEVAAHVHDSVLHTLTLIQRHVDDPREIGRLARAQERELRAWLYRPVQAPDTTFQHALEAALAEVEDAHGVAIDIVVVGDAPVDENVRALLGASREAAVNAAKHGGGAPVSVYAEVEHDAIEVFVRDRGPGFDLANVPADRMGVRGSIVGRMERHGGRASVHSVVGEGTEVALRMPCHAADRRVESQ